jgi:BCD family chlorophyll transporter-like MFS transporter
MQEVITARDGPEFRLVRTIKIGTFYIGSAMVDLLTSAIWNRVMIVDLGMAAWPVALLAALRYLLAPLSMIAGHLSDTKPLFGLYRLPYIWLGRALMLIALPALPLSTLLIVDESRAALGWSIALVSFLVYGAGTLISGPAFLALVHDSVPYERRGQAIGIVQFLLIASFAFFPVIYGALMPEYDPDAFRRLVILAMIGALLLWFFSVLGEERSKPRPAVTPNFRESFRVILGNKRTRSYAAFLSASALFAFMQDAVLEPFGGDVFGLPVGETTRFNAYWGIGVLIAMVVTIYLTRRRRPEGQVRITAGGLVVAALGITLLGIAALREMQGLLIPALFIFGLGLGVFTAGGVSLLMAMSKENKAGSYLALWSAIQLVSRGSGIAIGGAVRDLALEITGAFSSAYAAVFFIEGLGVLFSIWLLSRTDIVGFVREGEG